MFYKKYLVINSMNALGSLGLVYLLCNGKTTRVKLAANTMKAPKGDLWVALLLDRQMFIKELTGKAAEFELECATLNRAECLIACKSQRLEALAYASDGASDSGALLAMLKSRLEKRENDAEVLKLKSESFAQGKKSAAYISVDSEGQSADAVKNDELSPAEILAGDETSYDAFVSKTRNYFEDTDIVLDKINQNKSIEEYSEAFKRYYEQQNGEGNYYLSVKEQLQNLFDSFPAAPALIEEFDNSYWIKIEKKKRHFALGVLTVDGSPSYICYALPAEEGKNSSDEDFELLTLKNGDKYFILYQDTKDGSVKTKQAVS